MWQCLSNNSFSQAYSSSTLLHAVCTAKYTGEQEPGCKLPFPPKTFSCSFWWGKNFPEPIRKCVSHLVSTRLMSDFNRMLMWTKCVSTLHLYQRNYSVLTEIIEIKSWVIREKKKETRKIKCGTTPLHFKMVSLILMHHIQGASGRNLGLFCSYSQSKIDLMYKLLMHVQLCNGTFSIYRW